MQKMWIRPFANIPFFVVSVILGLPQPLFCFDEETFIFLFLKMDYCVTSMFRFGTINELDLSSDHEKHELDSVVFRYSTGLMTCEPCDQLPHWHPLVLRKSVGHIHIHLAHRNSSVTLRIRVLILIFFVFVSIYNATGFKSLSAVNVNYLEVS